MDPNQRSRGGGEPRSAGAWEVWSTCGRNSQAKTAAANGGRAAGWILLDDLLLDPGIQAGNLTIETCQQAVNLLLLRNLAGEDRTTDAAFQLASQLVTAQLNLAAGAAICPAVEGLVIAAQAVLAGAGFDSRSSIGGLGAGSSQRQAADKLTGQLQTYNAGGLCR